MGRLGETLGRAEACRADRGKAEEQHPMRRELLEHRGHQGEGKGSRREEEGKEDRLVAQEACR